ncbi:hypothetical protein [Mucisphaera sp.]|uniref:hypothetical protein n=1 Tax=Mucisphaera sp. TaxID=2913024 RepID=UPI003D0A2121
MPEENDNAAEQPKKLPMKTIIAVAAVVIIEAVVIVGIFMFAGGPETVEADIRAADEAALAEMPAEVLVVAEKFQNTRTGRAYLYDTEVYVVVKARHQAIVEQRIDTFRAQISNAMATIFRRAEPSFLLEPDLSTLRRQIHAALDEQFGRDEETGKSYIDQVLIPKATQFRSDG